ncbi:MAG: transposase [Planctomycetota bacterium]|jgi:REP element-mobilizing transposase RayT
MSRPWRIQFEGALYHLLSRGNDIFVDEKDRSGFLDAAGEMSERYDIDIFAYVLMDNHYHLLVRIRRANLKKVTAAKTFDPEKYLRKAEQIFGCSAEHFVHAKRLSGAEKENRDMLLYGIWKTGQLKNKQIGNLFGLSYSGISHAVKSTKLKLSNSRQFQLKFNQFYSLFKL